MVHREPFRPHRTPAGAVVLWVIDRIADRYRAYQLRRHQQRIAAGPFGQPMKAFPIVHDVLPWIEYLQRAYAPQTYTLDMGSRIDEATDRLQIVLRFDAKGRRKDGRLQRELFVVAETPHHPNEPVWGTYDTAPCFAAKKRVELILDRNETWCDPERPLRLQLQREGKLPPVYGHYYPG